MSVTDSDKLTLELQAAENAPDTGRDPVTGRFLNGNKGTSPGRKAQAYLSKKLEEILPGRDKSANDEQLDWMIELSRGCPNMPDPEGKGLRYKLAKESVWAFRALWERAYGPPMKDPEELDAMRDSGKAQVAVVVLRPDPRFEPPHSVEIVKSPLVLQGTDAQVINAEYEDALPMPQGDAVKRS